MAGVKAFDVPRFNAPTLHEKFLSDSSNQRHFTSELK